MTDFPVNNNTMEKQQLIDRLCSPAFMDTDKLHWARNILIEQKTEPTKQQINTMNQLMSMNMLEQRKYIIFNDRLMITPQKQQNWCIRDGKWQKTHRKYPTSYK